MAKYSSSSPYSKTKVTDFYLDLLTIRPIPKEDDDFLYTIENQYEHRPDLLAYDLYGDAALWWVFVQRNMNVIKDPVYDFEIGTSIYIPKKSNLKKFLGV
jgi:hypothetical protein|tara:strand:- start:1156 stop:1455 length:300 start_codon:yes stop_codon:yes gene_type:complete